MLSRRRLLTLLGAAPMAAPALLTSAGTTSAALSCSTTPVQVPSVTETACIRSAALTPDPAHLRALWAAMKRSQADVVRLLNSAPAGGDR